MNELDKYCLLHSGVWTRGGQEQAFHKMFSHRGILFKLDKLLRYLLLALASCAGPSMAVCGARLSEGCNHAGGGSRENERRVGEKVRMEMPRKGCVLCSALVVFLMVVGIKLTVLTASMVSAWQTQCW